MCAGETHGSRDGGDPVVAEGEHDDVLGSHHLFRNTRQLVVAEVKGHQVLHLEEVRGHSGVVEVVVAQVDHLGGVIVMRLSCLIRGAYS